MKKLAIAAEASAFHLKVKLVEFMKEKGYDFTDLTGESMMSYIDAGKAVGEGVSSGKYDMAVVLCGSGMGVNLVANRYPRVYCGLCESYDTARMARTITNCNVLAMGGNFVAYTLACRMLEVFVETEFTEDMDPELASALNNWYADMNKLDMELHNKG